MDGWQVVLTIALTIGPATRLSAQCPDGSPPPCRPLTPRASTGIPQNSVAVLYFDNLSRDTADLYLADGLTEELIARLGQVEQLQVKSRAAVQRFRGRSLDDPAVLGRTLGVANLVSGSVRRSGGRLRVTAELTRAASGVRAWGDVFQRTDGDVMAVEIDIAQAIAAAVGGHLASSERRTLRERPTLSTAAYDHYLRGNYLLSRRTPLDARRGVEAYESAVRLDPSFAGAYASIGIAYSLFIDWTWPYPGLTADSLLARGFAAADRALALDSLSADAWAARGLLLSYRNPATFAGALAALQRATTLDPRNAEIAHRYAAVLMLVGKDAEALEQFHRALDLEPTRAITLLLLSQMFANASRFDDALHMIDSAITVDPGAYFAYAMRGWVHLWRGEVSAARTDAETAVRLRPADYPWDTEGVLAALEAQAGDSAAARARAERLASQFADPAHPDFNEGFLAGGAFAVAGERERALTVLESVRPRGIWLGWALRDRSFDAIRDQPRFQRLVEETRPR